MEAPLCTRKYCDFWRSFPLCHGISVFCKDQRWRHLPHYSAHGRGSREHDQYNYLDLAPKGRDEDGLPFTMSWLRHQDLYEDGGLLRATLFIGSKRLRM